MRCANCSLSRNGDSACDEGVTTVTCGVMVETVESMCRGCEDDVSVVDDEFCSGRGDEE